MDATARKLKHSLMQIVKLAYDAQADEGLSPDEVSALDEIMGKAIELAGSEETVSEFIKGL